MVRAEDASATWVALEPPGSLGSIESPHSNPVFRLERMNLRVRSGELCFVCGEVGSGKSSLLYLLLGEMPLVNGVVQVRFAMLCALITMS